MFDRNEVDRGEGTGTAISIEGPAQGITFVGNKFVGFDKVVELKGGRKGEPVSVSALAHSESSELVVTLDKEEWHPFDYRALILGLKVTITNKTDRDLTIFGFGWEPLTPWTIATPDGAITAERYRLASTRHGIPGVVPALDSISGWQWMDFVHRVQGGRPGYVFTVEDELKNKHRLRMEPREPEVYGATP